MAPVKEPKKRVKSIKKPGDNPIAKTKKFKKCNKLSTFMNLIFRNVIRKRTVLSAEVALIIMKIFMNMIGVGKTANGVTRRKKKFVTVRDAQMAVASVLPGELGYRAHLSAMNAIAEFRRRHASDLARLSQA
ncbi:uncharacterized protein LOC124639623 [Helicoverpa zea]|uniref:uncharacterized protein LOC124639623 n=1 Tax=Helicoverpa zea TaxID=7113 RepID=UPI001F5ACA92|nr:uncharacterized protein LOC124639623 [Helicoverpa zea]